MGSVSENAQRSKKLLIVGLIASIGMSVAALAQGGPQGGPFSQKSSDYWQPGWMHREMWGHERMHGDIRARMQRHWTFMHGKIPTEYDRALSPLKPTPDIIKAGGKLYAANCSGCHGAHGMGDGAAAKSLSPSPALLAYMIQRPMAVDGYLLWTVSEGGEQLKTGMPAFKKVLSREQIWQIVAYMRAGFPPHLD